MRRFTSLDIYYLSGILHSRAQTFALGCSPTSNLQQFVAMVATRSSSTRISAAGALNQKKAIPEKPKTNVKPQTKKTTTKKAAADETEKPPAAGRKRKASDPEPEPERDSEPKVEEKTQKPAAKKAKVRVACVTSMADPIG